MSVGAFHLEDISWHPAPYVESADCVWADAQAGSCCSIAASLGESAGRACGTGGDGDVGTAVPSSPGTVHQLGHLGSGKPAALLNPPLTGLRVWGKRGYFQGVVSGFTKLPPSAGMAGSKAGGETHPQALWLLKMTVAQGQ